MINHMSKDSIKLDQYYLALNNFFYTYVKYINIIIYTNYLLILLTIGWIV